MFLIIKKSLSFHGHLLVLLAVLQNQSRQRQRTARRAHHQPGHAETAEKHWGKFIMLRLVRGACCAESKKKKFCSVELCWSSRNVAYKIWTNYVIINWAPFWFRIPGCILFSPALHGVHLSARVSRVSASRAPQPFRERLRRAQPAEIPMSGVKKARLLSEMTLLLPRTSAGSPRTNFQNHLLMWACVNHLNRQLHPQM